MGKKLTTEEFIVNARKVHGDRYDYSLVVYKTTKTKINIICRKHGVFEQIPNNHICGANCFECGVEKVMHLRKRNLLNNRPDFIEVNPPEGSMVLPISKDRYCLIDIEDYDRLSRHVWSIRRSRGCFYARNNAVGSTRLMHRIILDIHDPKQIVDHINRNGLDNRKVNLRLCTQQQNSFNRPGNLNSFSTYKGIYFDKRYNKWVSSINYNRTYYFLGHFESETQAAKVYDLKAKELFGEFAYLNFPTMEKEELLLDLK